MERFEKLLHLLSPCLILAVTRRQACKEMSTSESKGAVNRFFFSPETTRRDQRKKERQLQLGPQEISTHHSLSFSTTKARIRQFCTTDQQHICLRQCLDRFSRYNQGKLTANSSQSGVITPVIIIFTVIIIIRAKCTAATSTPWKYQHSQSNSMHREKGWWPKFQDKPARHFHRDITYSQCITFTPSPKHLI